MRQCKYLLSNLKICHIRFLYYNKPELFKAVSQKIGNEPRLLYLEFRMQCQKINKEWIRGDTAFFNKYISHMKNSCPGTVLSASRRWGIRIELYLFIAPVTARHAPLHRYRYLYLPHLGSVSTVCFRKSLNFGESNTKKELRYSYIT